jgi:hypothetical protein
MANIFDNNVYVTSLERLFRPITILTLHNFAAVATYSILTWTSSLSGASIKLWIASICVTKSFPPEFNAQKLVDMQNSCSALRPNNLRKISVCSIAKLLVRLGAKCTTWILWLGHVGRSVVCNDDEQESVGEQYSGRKARAYS